MALVLGSSAGLSLAASPSQVLGVRQQLPNDLVWLFPPQSELPLVTLQLLIKAGTLVDPRGKEGLANLTASLLLSGTKSRSATQIARELDFMGAKLRVEGGEDWALLSLTMLKKDLGQALELLKDVLLNPAFAPAEMKRKVAQLKAALESEQDEPMVVAARSFARKLYGSFPYGHPVRGTPEGLSAHPPPGPAAGGGAQQRYQPGQHHPGEPGDHPEQPGFLRLPGDELHPGRRRVRFPPPGRHPGEPGSGLQRQQLLLPGAGAGAIRRLPGA